MTTARLDRDARIGNTVRAWNAMGIDTRFTYKQTSKLQRVRRIELDGELMTLSAFAKRFPYAANPSN